MTLADKKETLQTIAGHLIEFAESLVMVVTIELEYSPSGKYKVVSDVRPSRGSDGEYEKDKS